MNGNPFPGMNPYLEQDDAWHDFHEQFCIECRRALLEQLPPHYVAKLDENVYIHELPEESRHPAGRGDVTVAREGVPGRTASGRATTAPAYGRVVPHLDVFRESFIEIHDRRSREVVAVLELLSPSNKRPGGDREQFLTNAGG